MKNYDSGHIKNIALLGHSGTGKTTLAETMMFEAGIINRRGAVEDKNTVSDYSEIEQERGNSIFGTPLYTEWRDYKINIIDTPGYDDFAGEVLAALKIAETGVMLLNAQYGVEVGTELIWEYTEKFKTPIIFAVNQLDHEKADFDMCVEQAKERYGRSKVAVVQYPLNQGHGFNSIIDVLKMVMYEFPPEGGKPEKKDIPESEKARANELHRELIESIAENDEGLMELYFEKDSLDEDEMRKGLKAAMTKHEIFPLFCLSAKQNMGSGRLMGFIDNVAPSSAEMPPQKMKDGSELKCDPNGPEVLFVYKTISEPHMGELSFFKVYCGKVSVGDDLYNEQTGATERINQLYVMQGKKKEPVDTIYAGDIGTTVKLKNTHTNNTLHPKGKAYAILPIEFPPPRIRTAVLSKSKGDEEKLAVALHKIQEEDPTVIVEHSQELKQLILHGQGEMHLSLVKWKLEKIFGLEVEFTQPRIPYRETIQKAVESHYRHKKQSGGAGQFAEVYMLIEPYYEGMPKPKDLNVRGQEVINLEWGGKLVFLNCIVGGAIDAKYLPSVMKGVMEKMHNGPLTGSYVRDVRVSVYDGKMHSVDSNDMAFKIAGMMAFKNAFHDADPKILEPIYEVEVLVPEEIMGDVMSDLQTRRAIIQGMEADGHYQKIKAQVPLAELYKYSSALRSVSQGRAKHKRQFHSYAPVPYEIQEQLIAAHKEELQEA